MPAGRPLNVQLVKFQRNQEKVGIVVDKYGDIQGLVTVEDILDEIVGDFTTLMSPTLAGGVNPQSDGSVLIDGTANVRVLNKAFNWNLPANEARSMNGMLLEALEEIPEIGIQVLVGHYVMEILDMQENMIKQVRVAPNNSLQSSVGSY